MLFLHLEEQDLEEQALQPQRGYKNRLPRFWRQIIHAVDKDSRKLRRRSLAPRKIHTFDDVLDAIISFSPNLSALQELKVDCWNLPSSCPPLSRFLTKLWMPIRENLRILSFGGNLHQYRTLIESKPAFQALKVLEVDFNNRDCVAQQLSDNVTLLEVVVPFIQMLKPQLESLRVSSSAELHFSAFFEQLGPFPALEVIDISMLNYNFSPNQAGISEILQRTLTHKYLTLPMIG